MSMADLLLLAAAAAGNEAHVVDSPPPCGQGLAPDPVDIVEVTDEDNRLRLEELSKLDADPSLGKKDPGYMSGVEMREELKLRGKLGATGHAQRSKHGPRLQGIRVKDAAAKQKRLEIEKADQEKLHFFGSGAVDDDLEDQEYDLKQADGSFKKSRWCLHDWLRLIVVMVSPVCQAALMKYATGFEDPHAKGKRKELDDRAGYDPWQGAFRDTFNSEAVMSHPCPENDEVGLGYIDPNKGSRGWTGDKLKNNAAKIKSYLSLILADWCASGQNNTDNLYLFCEPSTQKRRNIGKIPSKVLRVSACCRQG
jgi:hypothetical protein